MKISYSREELNCGDKQLRLNIETTYKEVKVVTTAVVAFLASYVVALKESLISL